VTETKSAAKSLGIVGPLVGLVVLGVNWWKPGLGLTEADVAPMIDAGATVWTAVTGIIGRWRATKQVSITGN
jgi:hypothetical protein